jgi:predicted permease
MLARTLPRAFRKAYGREMLLDLEALLAHRRLRWGKGAVVVGLMGAVWDLTGRIAREWGRVVARGLGVGTTRQERQGGSRTRRESRKSLGLGIELRMGETMMSVMRELRLAARSLLRKPGFSGVAALTLGLGMGSVLAIFTLVNAILLQPLPYLEPDGIIEIEHHAPAIELPNLNNSSGTLALYRESADFFSKVVGLNSGSRVLTGLDQAAQVDLLYASPEIFEVLGYQPSMGRPFGEADAVEGAAPVVVLTHDEWRSRFGGDPDVLGQTIELDGVTTEIIGVMPEDFELVQPGPVALAPLIEPAEPEFGTFGTTGLARLAPGVTLEQARNRIEVLQARIPERFPSITQEELDGFGWGVSLVTLKENLVEDVATVLWLVLGTVGFVLLIACANVANLFLVRAEGRQKEIAVRAAMGAGRGSVAASFVYESLILGLAGGLLGVVVAALGVQLLVTYGPQDIPRLPEVAIDPTVLGVAALLSVVVGVLLGLLPMTRYSARTFVGALRDGGRANTAGRGRNRARSALVMSQLALALILLVGSGLMFRSFAEMRRVDLGFEVENILTVGMRVGDGIDRPEAAGFYRELQSRVAALPGVQGVGITTALPLGPGNTNGGSFYIESRPREEGALPPVAMYRAAGPGFFASMGIRIVQGRDMEAADLDGSAARVWIDQYFADTFFDGDALGERIAWRSTGDEDESPQEQDWAEVVGIFANVKQHGIREDPMGHAYFPLIPGQLDYPDLEVGFLAVRVQPGIAASSLTPAIREEVNRLDRQVPITRVQTAEEVLSSAMAGESITLILLGIAAAMALFLGSIGLFGVISYVVTQRTREIGVRIALGARASEVSSMVLRQGVAVSVAGVVLGLAGSFGLTRLMGTILYEVSATDPLTFVAAPIVLLGVSSVATWLPARRAARVDPVESLRQE